MPINPDLLIAAPMLQDSFIDKDGTPMAQGVVTCYQDNSRTTLKNWYYQSSNFADANGNYTFSPLPNPLTLSAAGTICDINGFDTIPFFYPYSEVNEAVEQPYYITIVNKNQTNQITRPNFPYNRESTSPEVNLVAINNLIINNGFWRNLQPNYINQSPFTSIALNSIVSSTPYTTCAWTGVSTLFGAIVAPSQHDGFAMPDIQFLKNNTSGTDALTFTPFPLNTHLLINDPQDTITPEYYINHVCSVAGSAETVKCYQFPIALHLNNLSNFPFTVSIQAQNNGGTGTGANVISLQLLQFTGSGTSSPAPIIIAGTTITLNSEWQTYPLSATFPSSAGLSLSNTEDDAWYLQVQMPMNVLCNINFTKPSLYLTENALPQNDLLTYDQVDAVINSPRTGDGRNSLNSFYQYGWIPANDGTIGSKSSSATTRANSDTWPLYSLLYVNVPDSYAPVTGGRTSPGNTIAAALTDFIANKPIALTKNMGRVMLGTVPVSTMFTTNSTTVSSVTSGTLGLLITTTNNVNYFNGMPIIFTNSGGSLPTGLMANTGYYVAAFNGTNAFYVATSFANAMSQTVIAFTNAGSGTQTVTGSLAGGFEGEYSHLQLINEIGNHRHLPLTPTTSFYGAGSGLGLSAGAFAFGSANTTGLIEGNGTNSYTGQVPFNITQPGSFWNIFIKL